MPRIKYEKGIWIFTLSIACIYMIFKRCFLPRGYIFRKKIEGGRGACAIQKILGKWWQNWDTSVSLYVILLNTIFFFCVKMQKMAKVLFGGAFLNLLEMSWLKRSVFSSRRFQRNSRFAISIVITRIASDPVVRARLFFSQSMPF